MDDPVHNFIAGAEETLDELRMLAIAIIDMQADKPNSGPTCAVAAVMIEKLEALEAQRERAWCALRPQTE